LLNKINKIFEKIVAKEKIIKKRNDLDNCNLQYGFRPGKSIEDAFNKLCKSIYTLKEGNCKYVIAIFFDIMGAFDNLWWPSLLVELKKLNIRKKLWNCGKLSKTTLRTG